MNCLLLAPDAGSAAPLLQWLSSRGHTTRDVASADALLEETGRCPAQTIITVGLPPAEVADLCDKLRARPLATQLTLAIPAGDSPGEALALLEAGADDVLPSNPADPMFEVRFAAAVHRLQGIPDSSVDFPALLDSASDIIYLLDLEGRFLYINAAAEAISGYTPQQVRGRSIAEFVMPQRREQQAAMLAGRAAGNTAVAVYTSEALAKDGRRLILEVHTRPVLKDGRPIAIQGIARDITARVREEEQRALLAAIIASSDSAVVSYDLEGRITSWNPGAMRLYGWQPGEAIGQTSDFLVAPGFEASHGELARAAHEGRPATLETVRRDRWGNLKDVRITVFPVFDKSGNQLGTGTSTRDIGAEKLARKELARSEERRHLAELARQQSELNYQAVFEGSGEALYVMERDAGGVFRCIAVNEAYVQLMDRTREFVLGRTPDETSDTPEAAARLKGHFESAAATGEPVQWEWTQQIRGEEVSAIVLLTPIATPGGNLRLIGSIRDITARQRAEAASREAQERLHAVLANAPVLLNAFDLDGRLTVSEGAALTRLRTFDELYGRTVLELYPGRHDIAAAVARAIAGESVEIEYELRDQHFVGRARPIRSPGGAISGAISVSFDVTARDAAQRALRTSEAYVRSLVEAAPVVLIATDAAGTIELTTGAGLGKLGRTPGQAVGLCAFQHFAAYPEIITSLRTALSGLPVLLESEMGGYFWESRYTPVFDDSGSVTGVIVVSTDVSDRRSLDIERQLAAAALQASEARLRALFDSSGDGLALLDNDLRVTSVNPSFQAQCEQLFGNPVTLGRRLDFRLPSDRARRLRQRLARALQGEHVFNRSDFTRIDGSLATMELTYYPVRQEDGSVSGVALVSRDVTARLLAEESLRTEQAFSRATIDSLPGIFYLIDSDGRFLRTNRKFQEISGYSPDEIAAMHVPDFFDEEDRQLIAGRMAQVFNEGESVAEANFVTKYGERIPYFFTGKRLLFEGRWVLAGMGTDVTWRRHAEAALRESEANLRAIFDSAVDTILLIDASLRVVSFNPSAAAMTRRIFGVELRKGIHLAEAYGGKHDDGSFRRVLKAALGGTPMAAEFALTDDGVSFEIVASPVQRDDGQSAGIVVLARDVTERKRSEEALRHAQKLESLGVLAGGIAHDFNNLLVGIIGNAGLALSELSPSSPARETIQDIELAGQRAADLARQMLAYSGKGRLVVHEVSVSALVEEMTHLLRVSLGKGVTLSFHFASGVPPVEADATQLRQVIMNLVVNASDAIGEAAGVITISTGVVDVTTANLAGDYLSPELRPGRYVSLDVADTGCGMDAETVGRIFDPFFTTKFTGRGLGLAAVLGIVRGHHGALKVSSQPGSGSTFRLLLPAASAPQGAAQEIAPASPAWRGDGVVLVVDDEPNVRAVTARALKSFGFTVLEAADGREGVERFRTAIADGTEVACVLLDMIMPRLNGDEAMRAIHVLRPGVPVVLLSGYGEHDATAHFAGQALAGFIQKPYDIATLRDTIRSALDR